MNTKYLKMAIGYLRRKETFSAAHRLHSPLLNLEENQAIYGKCNHIHGHGHNYHIEITLRGEINQSTGMIFNITELKAIIKKHVLHKLDHKNLDRDLEYFAEIPSTTENLAVFIWTMLYNPIATYQTAVLYEVLIRETEKNVVIYRGE